jgi:hypothetical protein
VDPEKCRLFIGNLPHGTNEKRLVKFIQDVGLEKSLTRVSHTPGKRFCFMSWKSYEDTVRAKKQLETSQLDGNRITVEYPKESDDRHRGGGGGGSRGGGADPRYGLDGPGGAAQGPGGGGTDLESIRNSLAQQLDVQRQQLLAKQKEVLEHERQEVLGPRGGPPPMADPRLPPHDPRRGGMGPPVGAGGPLGPHMGGFPLGGMAGGPPPMGGGGGGGGAGAAAPGDVGAVLQLLSDFAAAQQQGAVPPMPSQQGPPPIMQAPPAELLDALQDVGRNRNGPLPFGGPTMGGHGPGGGWHDRGRDGGGRMGGDGWRGGGDPRMGGGFGPMGGPREAVLFVPPYLTGAVIGKGGAVIKGLRQDAAEMQCAIDLQQQSRPPDGDGSAKVIITGANPTDVMQLKQKITNILDTADSRDRDGGARVGGGGGGRGPRHGGRGGGRF